MKLNVHIHKIKSIEDLEISLPTDKGLYAITGQNGSGKSTIVACASSVFFHLPMKEYFGQTEDGAYIKFEMNEAERIWLKDSGVWRRTQNNGKMSIRGFFEGSLIYGNRFRDTTYDKLKQVDKIDKDKLILADDFIRKNLGYILQGDEEFYEKMWFVSSNYEKFDGYIFFYEKNGKRISQFHMSTGENLLVSILNSIFIRIRDIKKTDNCVIFLDEVELALHPSSLKRLIDFLTKISNEYNYAIYFSTHSIELIRGINPENIFYIERHADNSIEVLNPCYPAYATKILYDHYGYDNVILVEDDLAKEIVTRIIKKEGLLNNKLVHVLPCGGHNNVLDLAHDVVVNNLLGKKASISVILDLDIKEKAEKYKNTKNICNNIPVQYLPIESLEKYLRSNLYTSVDYKLFRRLDNYIFQYKSLTDIISEYKTNKNYCCANDSSGKKLYGLIDNELRLRNKDRRDLIEIIIDYLFEEKQHNLIKIVEFLKKELN